MNRTDDRYRTVEIHAMACDAGHLRVWLGVFDAEPPHRLEWSLDGAPVPDEDVVARRPLELARSGAPEIVSRTGVFDLEIAGSSKPHSSRPKGSTCRPCTTAFKARGSRVTPIRRTTPTSP